MEGDPTAQLSICDSFTALLLSEGDFGIEL
jgi:hypothetical protein